MFWGWMLTITIGLSHSGLAISGETLNANSIHTTSTARLAVEEAWEQYHHAALGGTLASPQVQSQLEMNLHKSRELLAEAYDAERLGDQDKVQELLDQIMKITSTVITGSKESKK